MASRILLFVDPQISQLLYQSAISFNPQFDIICNTNSFEEFSDKVFELKPDIVIFHLASPIYQSQNFFADLAEAELSPILLAYSTISEDKLTYAITTDHDSNFPNKLENFFITALEEHFHCLPNYIGESDTANFILNQRLEKLERTEFLKDILRGVTKGEFHYYQKQAELRLKNDGYFLYLWDLQDIEYVDHHLNKNIYYWVGEILCEECQTVLDQYNGGEVFYINPTLLCLIINDVQTNSEVTRYQTLEELTKKLNYVLNCKTAVRYRSKRIKTIEDIRPAYDTFHRLKGYHFFCREAEVLTPSLLDKSSKEIDCNEIEQSLKQIKEYIQHQFTNPQLLQLLEELFLGKIKPSLNYQLYFYSQTGIYAALHEKFGAVLKQSLIENTSPQELIYSSIEQKYIDILETIHLLRGEVSNRYMIKNPMVLEAIDYIHEYFEEDINLKTMADDLRINHSYLSQIFTKEMGITLKKYLITYRIQKAKEMLESSNELVYTIAAKVGFFEAKHFSKTFKKITGHTPLQYKKQFSKDFI